MKDRENTSEKPVEKKFPKKLQVSDTDEPDIALAGIPISRQTPAFNFIVYPFHHLISAAQLASDETSPALSREERRRSFWQLLAAQGMPPAEAALLDDSLNCHFVERTAGAPVEIEWEVLYFHDLQGCAELYRAELLLWKRLVHDAEEALPAVVELDANPIIEFPDLSIPMIAKPRENYRLFLDNLTAPFDLAFSAQVPLAAYWNAWREAARSSRFDFDYLETIREARALRFYELTKLWRALSRITESAGLPAKMEIEYEKFAALMPLPLLNGESRIKAQIARMIQPHKEGGYVKSFSLKSSLEALGGRRTRLVFRFGD